MQDLHLSTSWLILIDLFTDTVAILISIVSNSHYGMPRGQIHINLPPEHPIMSFETIEIKMAAVWVKRSIRPKTIFNLKIQPVFHDLVMSLMIDDLHWK